MDDREKIKNALLDFASSLGTSDQVLREAKKINVIGSLKKKPKNKKSNKEFQPRVDPAQLTGVLTEYAGALGKASPDEISEKKQQVLRAANEQFIQQQITPEQVSQKTSMLSEYMNGIDSMFMSEHEKKRGEAEENLPILSESVRDYVDSKVNDLQHKIQQLKENTAYGMASNPSSNGGGGGGTNALQLRDGGVIEGNVSITAHAKDLDQYENPEVIELLDKPALTINQSNPGYDLLQVQQQGVSKLHMRNDGNTHLHNNLTIYGDLSATGNFNIALPTPALTGDLVPVTTKAFDLGTSSQTWRSIHGVSVNTESITINGTGTAFQVTGNSTLIGDVSMNSGVVRIGSVIGTSLVPQNNTHDIGTASIPWRTLYLTNLQLSGDATIGTDSSDTLTINSQIGSDLIPSTSTQQVGTLNNTWENVYAKNLHVTHSTQLSGVTVIGEDGNDTLTINATQSSHIIPTTSNNLNIGASSTRWGKAWLNDADLSNDLSVLGHTTLGSDATDNVTFNADVNSDIVANNNAHSLGSISQQWNTLYTQHVSASNNLTVGQNTNVRGHTTLDQNLAVSGSTTLRGDVRMLGDLYVDGNTYLSGGTNGSINIGDADGDSVIFNADVASTIIPDQADTYNLGTTTKRWGDINSQNLYITETAFISGNVTLGDSNIQTVTLNADVASNIEPDQHQVYDLGNNIQQWATLYTQDISASRDVDIGRNLHVRGDLRVDGNAYLSAGADGNIYVGDTNTDNVIFRADVDSDIVPDDHQTYTLGTSSQQWKTLFVQDMSASGNVDVDGDMKVLGNLVIGGSASLSAGDNNNIYVGDLVTDNVVFRAEVDSDIVPNFDTTYTLGTSAKKWKTLHVQDVSATNNLSVSGSTVLGSDNADNVTFRADINSNILPNTTQLYDLGSNTQQWQELFVQDISASNTVKIGNDLEVVDDTTISGNIAVSGTSTLSGDVHIYGDLRVDGNTYLSAGADGNIYIGDTNTDNVVFTADVDSDIVPDDHQTYTLGTSSQQWQELFVQDISASRDVDIGRNLHVRGDLRVDGNTYLSAGADGNIYIGDADTDNVVFTADVDSDIVPETGNSYDLGKSGQQWNNLFVNDISASGGYNSDLIPVTDITHTLGHANNKWKELHVQDISATGNIVMNGNLTLGSDSNDRLLLNSSVSGDIIPSDTRTFNLGSPTLEWDNLFVQDLSSSNDVTVQRNATVYGLTTIGRSDQSNVIVNSRFESHLIPLREVGSINYTLSNTRGTPGGSVDNLFDGSSLTSLNLTSLPANSSVIITIDLDNEIRGFDEYFWKYTVNGTGGTRSVELHNQDTGDWVTLVVDDNTGGGGSGTLTRASTLASNSEFQRMNIDGIRFTYAYTTTSPGDFEVFEFKLLQNSTLIDWRVVNHKYNLGEEGKQWEHLYVEQISAGGDVQFDANVTLGKSGTNIVMLGEVYSGIDPGTANTYDLGSSNLTWRTLHVQSVSARGNLDINGSTTLGDSDSDNVTFNADVNSDIIPDQNNTRKLGNSSRLWSEVHTRQLKTNSATLTGDLTVNGSTTLGDSSADNVTFNADVNSNIVPNTDSTLALGSTTQPWGTLHVQDVSAVNVSVTGETIIGSDDSDNVTFNADVNSHIVPDTNTTRNLGDKTNNKQWGTLYAQNVDLSRDATITRNLTVNGSTTLGDSTADNVVFNADVNSHIVSNTDKTYDLGSTNRDWRVLYVQDIQAAQNVTIENNLHVKGDLTVDGTAYLSAGADQYIYVGDSVDDSVVFNASIQSDLIPTGTRSIGSTNNRWGTAYVAGLNASGAVTFTGDTTIGNSSSDKLTINADINSHIIPVDANRNLGSGAGSSTIWNTLFVQNVSATAVQTTGRADIQGNTTLGSDDTNTLTINADVASDIIPSNTNRNLGDANSKWNTLHVQTINSQAINNTGAVTIDGDTTLGSDATDTVTFNADVASDIIPSTASRNLGDTTTDWNTLFVQNVSATDIHATGGIVVNNTISATDVNTTNINNLAFPAADGTAGHALVTDGSGNLSFDDPWNSVTTTTLANSANWDSVYTTTSATSASWSQTLSYTDSTSTLAISDGNSVSLSGIAQNIIPTRSNRSVVLARNDDSVTIDAGEPVYVTGRVGSSDTLLVRRAKASGSATLPAIGIAETALATSGGTQEGYIATNGVLNININTTGVSGLSAAVTGDTIYVGQHGGLSVSKPARGDGLVQNLGQITSVTSGTIHGFKLASIDRTNDVPNLPLGNIFYGDTSNDYYSITPLSAAIYEQPNTNVKVLNADTQILSGGTPLHDIFATVGSTGGTSNAFSLQTVSTSGTHSQSTGKTHFIYDDTTANGAITIGLLSPASHAGVVTHKKIGNTATVTLSAPTGVTIDGAGTYDMTVQYEALSIFTDGNNYFIQ
jgi:cytoskeletal protein CcmA (bactofilin family)